MYNEELKSDLMLLKDRDEELKMIEKYLEMTKGPTTMTLENVWSCNRHGEADHVEEFDIMENRKLLWHGTNVAVVAAILQSGLRIMPHSGGRVGAGIYLADQHNKSAGYVAGTKASDGRNSIIMFLVEAALGREKTILMDDWGLKKAPRGFDSVVARGTVEPDPKDDVVMDLDGLDVTVPQGKEIKTRRKSAFVNNEFLVYNEKQHRIRFVLRFKDK